MHPCHQFMAHTQARPGQVAVRRIPGQGEIIRRQAGQVHRHILLVVLKLMLLRHLGKKPGIWLYLHTAQQPHAQAT
ncbi:hypothetical protein D9M71_691470 [compost metagenome]